jgi:50S ribosomal subunit-associated GTPase HflX
MLQMNLENHFGGEKAGIKVLDRTALILDIFAQHAKTKEGKLQVRPPLTHTCPYSCGMAGADELCGWL